MKGWDLVKGGWDLQKERDKGMADWGVRMSESESDIPHFSLLTQCFTKEDQLGFACFGDWVNFTTVFFWLHILRLPCFNKIEKS